MGASVSHTFYQGSQVCSGTAHPVSYVEIGLDDQWPFFFFFFWNAQNTPKPGAPDAPTQHTLAHNLKWGPSCCAKTSHFPFSASKSTFATAATLHHNTTPQDCLSPATSSSSSSYRLTPLILAELNSFQRRCIFPTQPPWLLYPLPSRRPAWSFYSYYLPSSLFQHLLQLLFSILPLPLFHFSSPPAALASSCWHTEQTQHTSPHQGHTIGTLVCMCMSLCVCLPGAVVTVGPHRVWAVAYCDILYCRLTCLSALIHCNLELKFNSRWGCWWTNPLQVILPLVSFKQWTIRCTGKANIHTPTCCWTRTYSCVSTVVTRECHTLRGHLKCFSAPHEEMLVEKVETTTQRNSGFRWSSERAKGRGGDACAACGWFDWTATFHSHTMI